MSDKDFLAGTHGGPVRYAELWQLTLMPSALRGTSPEWLGRPCGVGSRTHRREHSVPRYLTMAGHGMLVGQEWGGDRGARAAPGSPPVVCSVRLVRTIAR
jgi:hypothetical protein